MMTNKMRANFHQWIELWLSYVNTLSPLRKMHAMLGAIHGVLDRVDATLQFLGRGLGRIDEHLVGLRTAELARWDYEQLVAVEVELRNAVVAEKPIRRLVLGQGQSARVVFSVTEQAKDALLKVSKYGSGLAWPLVHVAELSVGNESRSPDAYELGCVPAGTKVGLVLKYDDPKYWIEVWKSRKPIEEADRCALAVALDDAVRGGGTGP